MNYGADNEGVWPDRVDSAPTPGSEALSVERLREIRERVDAAKNRLQPWSHKKRAESILEQHALTDVPDLLAEVKRLTTENAVLQGDIMSDLISDRMQGVDCPECEDGTQHTHVKPSGDANQQTPYATLAERWELAKQLKGYAEGTQAVPEDSFLWRAADILVNL